RQRQQRNYKHSAQSGHCDILPLLHFSSHHVSRRVCVPTGARIVAHEAPEAKIVSNRCRVINSTSRKVHEPVSHQRGPRGGVAPESWLAAASLIAFSAAKYLNR